MRELYITEDDLLKKSKEEIFVYIMLLAYQKNKIDMLLGISESTIKYKKEFLDFFDKRKAFIINNLIK